MRFFLYAATITMSIVGCGGSNSSSNKKIHGVSRAFIGFQSGSTISFIGNKGENRWEKLTDRDFKIPANAKSFFLGDDKIGVLQKDNKFVKYRLTAPNYWEVSSQGQMTVSSEYEKVYMAADLVAFKKGNTLEFIYERAPYLGRLEPSFTFTAPKGCKDFFPGGGEGVLVVFDDRVEFYHFTPNQKYELLDTYSIPKDTKQIISLGGDFGFGVVSDEKIEMLATVRTPTFGHIRRLSLYVFPK